MPGHGEKHEQRKDEAITALLSHRTVEDAAKAIGIARMTMQRWKQRPDFHAEYLQVKRENFLQARAWLEQRTARQSLPYGRRRWTPPCQREFVWMRRNSS